MLPQCSLGTDSHKTHWAGGVCCSDGVPKKKVGSVIWKAYVVARPPTKPSLRIDDSYASGRVCVVPPSARVH